MGRLGDHAHELCLITTCMGRLAHLQQTLGPAAAQARASCIVVDYSCPEHCGDWVEQTHPGVKVVRVPNQQYFNPAHARNVGAAAADAPWLCFFDADMILSPQFAERMLPTLQAGNIYLTPCAEEGLLPPVICRRADFIRIGGYDEVFQSWGHEDVDLYLRLFQLGLQQQLISTELVRRLPHDSGIRVANFAIKDPFVSQTINFLYRTAKFDVMRLQARELSVEERRRLHAEAGRTVDTWLRNRQETAWSINFCRTRGIFGQEIHSTLVYTLKPPPQNPS